MGVTTHSHSIGEGCFDSSTVSEVCAVVYVDREGQVRGHISTHPDPKYKEIMTHVLMDMLSALEVKEGEAH